MQKASVAFVHKQLLGRVRGAAMWQLQATAWWQCGEVHTGAAGTALHQLVMDCCIHDQVPMGAAALHQQPQPQPLGQTGLSLPFVSSWWATCMDM